MIETIRKPNFIEGRWLNGAGVSWDIASEPPGAGLQDFDWRFATALIERDAPFSVFPGVDRIITLIDGGGFNLDIEGTGRISINQPHVPTPFPGDESVVCRVPGRPSMVLNLLLARGRVTAEVSILRAGAQIEIECDGALILAFALSGTPALTLGVGDVAELNRGDAAVVRPEGSPISLAVSGRDGASLYVAAVRTCAPD